MPKNHTSHGNADRRQARPRRGRERRLSIRSELRREPDIDKIARAVVALAIAQAEKEAAEDAAKRSDEVAGGPHAD